MAWLIASGPWSRGPGSLSGMCGIVAVLCRPSRRPVPSAAELLALADQAVAAIDGPDHDVDRLDAAATLTEEIDRLLHGVPGVMALVGDEAFEVTLLERVGRLDDWVAGVERAIGGDDEPVGVALEAINAAIIRARDALWAVRHDRVRTARAVQVLAGRGASVGTVAGYLAIQHALSSLDRLEVRGRDSAGLQVMVQGHGLDLADPALAPLVCTRLDDALLTSGSLRSSEEQLIFVYKAAAEIGELGDNTKSLRAAIQADPVLRLALAAPAARAMVLAHTRWASVGIISEPNAHPVSDEELDGRIRPFTSAVLNGDVDNYGDLKAEAGLRLATEITTDAKVIPALFARAAETTADPTEAFRSTVATFEGSVAIAATAANHPDRVFLALRGSGQALYIGIAEDLFLVASEPYGLVEETSTYLRLDGETPTRADQAQSTRGQVVVLDARLAGSLDGVERLGYDGTALPVSDGDLSTAEITTRDINRGDFPHYLLKEITEAPESFLRTLRGRIVERDGRLRVQLDDRALPPAVVALVAGGRLKRLIVIGQGTAAVAGRAIAAALRAQLGVPAGVAVEPMIATELSGFAMPSDLSDTLIVAVSQSGTTTDTNRTVDLARDRGATVIAIVNRRNSDLTDKADAVLYTSDGRDVEMSVASTKAFYSQVAAGFLLSAALGELAGVGDARARHDLLDGLRRVPAAMRTVLGQREAIADAARRFAPPKRYWAVVGNGPNAVAAEEVRIKLSELCYKSIACDITEDKKHIDLSSEPLILVCAAGLEGSTADDVAKEVAIYRAHKATPIVIATEGEGRFQAAYAVISVPAVASPLAFILSAMVGHLFGYEAALAIDALALPLRQARESIELALESSLTGEEVVAHLMTVLAPVAQRFNDTLRSGTYDGHLEASTAVRLASLLRVVGSPSALDAYELDHGKVGTPDVLVADLTAALSRAIDELTRPIDAIKHQAKTVTVGISRSDEALVGTALVRQVLEAGAGRDRITYRSLKVLADLAPAVAAITGYTRYSIEGDPDSGDATIEIVDRGGLGREVPSRVDRNPELRGTKRRVAADREVLVARGRSDGRSVVLVPEVKGTTVTGLTLLHVRFVDRLPAVVCRGVLRGYGDRYAHLQDAVTETEPTFRDDLLADVDVVDLLTAPIAELANRWRS